MALPILFDVQFTLPDPLPDPPALLTVKLRSLVEELQSSHGKPIELRRCWVAFSPGPESGCTVGALWFVISSFRPEERAGPEEIAQATLAIIVGIHRGAEPMITAPEELERTREPGRYRLAVLDALDGMHTFVLEAVP